MTEMLTLRRAILLLALLSFTWTTKSHAEALPPSTPPQESSHAAPARLHVKLQLNQTPLTRQAILQALEEEFQMPLSDAESESGLSISIDAQQLRVSYRDDVGAVVERDMTLPSDESRMLDTVALLAGNLARDEASDLLLQLQRAHASAIAAAEKSADPEVSSEPPQKDTAPPQPEQSTVPPTKPAQAAQTPKAPKGDEPPSTNRPPAELRELEAVPFSASLAGSLSFPGPLREKRTHFELGLFHSDVGAVDGFALNLVALRNRGLDTKNQSKGIQVGGLWLRSSGFFRGASVGGLVSHMSGGTRGIQGAGLVAIQTDDMSGVQGAGLVAISGGPAKGAQLALLSAVSRGGIQGVQGSLGLALNRKELRGIQAALLGVHTSGRVQGLQFALGSSAAGDFVDGQQISAVNVASFVDGSQLGLVNISHQGFDGFQLGFTNVAGDFQGTQVGLVNIGGRGKGTQIALVNVARDLKGPALAPVNIIPGARNQLLTYVSYSNDPDLEGLPAGPMTHLAVRVLPGPVYTQANFGLGAEATECQSTTEDSSCIGGATEYAVGLAIGARAELVKKLFLEFDLQYQFEKAFSSSSNMRHSVLGRVALAYQFFEPFAVFVGAGPRLNLKTGPAANPDPDPSFAPHFFGGVQFF